MLHKMKNGEILKGLTELANRIPPSVRNKQLLLEMAARGDPKPHWRTLLGKVFKSYTSKQNSAYDAAFHEKARKAAPRWFVGSSEQNKLLLLKMAEKGKPKPHWKSPLGRSLTNYLGKKANSYDPIFAKKIMKLAPDWLMSRSEKCDHKKRLLLVMARRGEPRPSQRTKIGQALCGYTGKSSKCYDPVFAREIMRLAPHWFKKKPL